MVYTVANLKRFASLYTHKLHSIIQYFNGFCWYYIAMLEKYYIHHYDLQFTSQVPNDDSKGHYSRARHPKHGFLHTT